MLSAQWTSSLTIQVALSVLEMSVYMCRKLNTCCSDLRTLQSYIDGWYDGHVMAGLEVCAVRSSTSGHQSVPNVKRNWIALES